MKTNEQVLNFIYAMDRVKEAQKDYGEEKRKRLVYDRKESPTMMEEICKQDVDDAVVNFRKAFNELLKSQNES